MSLQRQQPLPLAVPRLSGAIQKTAPAEAPIVRKSKRPYPIRLVRPELLRIPQARHSRTVVGSLPASSVSVPQTIRGGKERKNRINLQKLVKAASVAMSLQLRVTEMQFLHHPTRPLEKSEDAKVGTLMEQLHIRTSQWLLYTCPAAVNFCILSCR